MAKIQAIYNKEFVEIGLLRRAHGYKGHAKLAIEEHYLDELNQQEFVFIEVDGYKVPFKIEELTVSKDIVVKFYGISSPEDLNKYHQHGLFLLKEDINASNINRDEYNELTGMTIIDQTIGEIGKIVRIEEFPQQLMAIIISEKNKEILIPLHPDLIIDIDQESLELHMDLPEGLI